MPQLMPLFWWVSSCMTFLVVVTLCNMYSINLSKKLKMFISLKFNNKGLWLW